MARPKNPKVAIVCAWRAGEDDLKATIEDAQRSAGKAATVYAVEDKTAQGPAHTRHRGIEAAKDADVIVIIDAHMRFKGDALAQMAKHAAKSGLCCALTYHNEACSFTGNPYSGARIVFKALDGRTHTALAGKWSRETKPGPRGCVMGGAYAFRRDWYYHVGQPLSMLPGWGGDEEALSIASWLSGQTPTCLDVEVAHRYRARPPWNTQTAEFSAVRAGRHALINAVVTEITARNELTEWQKRGVCGDPAFTVSPECERFRLALLELPRKWAEWRAQVCEPEEIDGVQAGKPTPVDTKNPRIKVQNPVIATEGIKCRHCSTVHDPLGLKVQDVYANGNRRFRCPKCGNNFIVFLLARRVTP